MKNENVHPIFKPVLDSISVDKIPTDHGNKTVPEIMDHLTWCSYRANREGGCSHEGLIKIGVGNDAMRDRYEKEKLRDNIKTSLKELNPEKSLFANVFSNMVDHNFENVIKLILAEYKDDKEGMTQCIGQVAMSSILKYSAL